MEKNHELVAALMQLAAICNKNAFACKSRQMDNSVGESANLEFQIRCAEQAITWSDAASLIMEHASEFE